MCCARCLEMLEMTNSGCIVTCCDNYIYIYIFCLFLCKTQHFYLDSFAYASSVEGETIRCQPLLCNVMIHWRWKHNQLFNVVQLLYHQINQNKCIKRGLKSFSWLWEFWWRLLTSAWILMLLHTYTGNGTLLWRRSPRTSTRIYRCDTFDTESYTNLFIYGFAVFKYELVLDCHVNVQLYDDVSAGEEKKNNSCLLLCHLKMMPDGITREFIFIEELF